MWRVYLPYEERDDQDNAEDERYDVMWATPNVLSHVS